MSQNLSLKFGSRPTIFIYASEKKDVGHTYYMNETLKNFYPWGTKSHGTRPYAVIWCHHPSYALRIPDSYDAKIAKLCNFWTFWPVMQPS